jgi:hypothetical protein
MPPPLTATKQQKTLPIEILEQIFKELSSRDLFTCQYVCKSWHVPAKRDFYKHVEFKTSFSINLFLTCINSDVSTIPSPGDFVKRIYFNNAPTTASMQNFTVGSTLSCQHIQAIAQACPNVTTIDCTQNLKDIVVTGLLSLDDGVWKILSSFPDGNSVPTDLYTRCAYKFRQSLATLYFNSSMNDFSYLCQFPSLTILDLSFAPPLQSIDELEYILNTSKQLTQLVLRLDMATNKQQSQQPSLVYPTLKLLKIRTVDGDDQVDYTFLKYIMHKFNKLVSLEMYAMDLLDISLNDKQDYTALIKWMNSLKSSELVLRGHDYNRIPQVATEYLLGIFSTQVQRMNYSTTLNIYNSNPEMINMNSITFLVFSTMTMHSSWMQRDIDIQLPQFETDNRSIHHNYISQFAPYVNELYISYEGTPIYTHGCSWFLESVMRHCSVLRSINLNYCELSLVDNTAVINESITDVTISNSQIASDFFSTLSFCCPNLNNLTLHRNFHSRHHQYSIWIDMPHTQLDCLSLIGEELHFPWISTAVQQGSNSNIIPRWYIYISTADRARYFQLDSLTSAIYESKQPIHIRQGVISIGVQCKEIRKFRISTSIADTTLDL